MIYQTVNWVELSSETEQGKDDINRRLHNIEKYSQQRRWSNLLRVYPRTDNIVISGISFQVFK